jgi:hypothetical protein
MFRGRAGTSDAIARNPGSESCRTGLKRRSKPIVVLGRPHMPLPQNPSKWAGKTST